MQYTHNSEQDLSLENNVLVIDPAQVSSETLVPIQVITSRAHYQCCHIRFEDSASERGYPAIFFSGHFYSLCFTKAGESDAFRVAMLLTEQGRSIIITKIPKGYAVWVLELDAIPVSSKIVSSQSRASSTHTAAASDLVELEASDPLNKPNAHNPLYTSASAARASCLCPAPNLDSSPTELAPYRVLMANEQHQLCQIHLPHMKKPCLCICIDSHYYKLFKTVETPRQAAKLVKLLTHYDEQSVMTKMSGGYGIWRLIDKHLLNALWGYKELERV